MAGLTGTNDPASTLAGAALHGSPEALRARRLLTGLRVLLADDEAPIGRIADLIARELETDVCSIYAARDGDMLELRATHGLKPSAVGRVRLRVGEGIVGLAAATGEVLNLADAQNHPQFVYRPETGEESYAAMLAVPVRRARRTLGVVTLQDRQPRRYALDDVELVETAAMLLAEVLGRAREGSAEGIASNAARQFEGSELAAGLVIGRVVLHGALRAPRRLLAQDIPAELARLELAGAAMRRSLDALIEERLPDGEAPREVLAATRLVAADDGWLRRVSEAVADGLTAEAAVHRVAAELRDRMHRIKDPYLRERLADMEDLAGRLLESLLSEGSCGEEQPDASGAILLARRLGPAQLLEWHARGIAAVAIEEGSASGHAAILARALSLPGLGGVRGATDAASPGDMAVLDADGGVLILRPEPELKSSYAQALAARGLRQAAWQALRDTPPVTRDGTPFTLMMNAGLPLELGQLAATGAEGVGLFRTEIAMMARGEIADVEEQTALYARVMDLAGDRPVLFRTLDLGSDKLLPDAAPVDEENPAMGWRSIRVGLDRPAVLRRQLRALLKAAAGRPLAIMFPMIATMAEFHAARAILHAEAARIRPAPERLAIGTMLEVPSLLWQLPELSREADFISIGSNDLAQFVYAADRGTPGLAARYDLLSEPMLSVLEAIRVGAVGARAELSLCGEAAGRPLDAVVLAALGITRLSMAGASVLKVKAALTSVDLAAFRPVLALLRRTATAGTSLREPLAVWMREHGGDTA
jgi:phosphotransferase system, enzyme I, PtsP